MQKMKEKAAAFSDFKWKRMAAGAIIGIVLMLLVQLLCAFLISRGTLEADKISLCAYASVGVSGLVAAFLGTGSRKKLFSALLLAIGMFVLLAVFGILFFSAVFSAKTSIFILIILLVSCIIGSIISSVIR